MFHPSSLYCAETLPGAIPARLHAVRLLHGRAAELVVSSLSATPLINTQTHKLHFAATVAGTTQQRQEMRARISCTVTGGLDTSTHHRWTGDHRNCLTFSRGATRSLPYPGASPETFWAESDAAASLQKPEMVLALATLLVVCIDPHVRSARERLALGDNVLKCFRS